MSNAVAFVLRCGEDFYVAVSAGMFPPLSQVSKAWTSTDDDLRDEDALRRFAAMKRGMEERFGTTVVNVLDRGGVAVAEEVSDIDSARTHRVVRDPPM